MNSENHSLDVYKEFQFDNIASIIGVSVFSRGQYAGTSRPSLTSKPPSKPEEWDTFWHPIFGTCYSFKPSQPLLNHVGLAGVDFVQVNLDFEAAFPPPPYDTFVQDMTTNHSYETTQAETPGVNFTNILCKAFCT